MSESKTPDRWNNTMMVLKKTDVMEGSKKYTLMIRLI